MPAPLYRAKAELFRMLGHPVRIQVREPLQDGPKPVRDLLAEIDIESSSPSRQLVIMRRSDIVTATRHGTIVVDALAGGDVAKLIRAARRILTEMCAGQKPAAALGRERGITPASREASADGQEPALAYRTTSKR
jgi:ArsR family transcriptional regulator, arsenate/arsenite/antimonite-responsive transcriptional repressor